MTTPNHHRIRTAARFTAGGESLTLAEWARRAGVSTETFRARFLSRRKAGWELEAAILEPSRAKIGSRVRTGLKLGRRGD